MLLPSPDEALDRVYRALVPNGIFAASVWDVPPKVPLLGFPMGVIGKMIELAPPAEGAPGLFSLADPGRLEGVFARAGFDDVCVEPISMTVELPSAKSFVNMIHDTASMITALIAELPAARQAEVWQAVEDAVGEQYGQSDGSIRMTNHAICVIGRRDGRVTSG